VLLISGIAAILVLGIFMLLFTGLPDWVVIALTAVGVLVILVGRGSDAAFTPVMGFGLLAVLVILIAPPIFRAIFEQPWIPEDEYGLVGSKQLDTREEVEDRFGEPAEDLGKDLGTRDRSGQACAYYWTKEFDLPGAQDNAYELCFQRGSGKFTLKRKVDLELVPG
jgi:hypothetical protein